MATSILERFVGRSETVLGSKGLRHSPLAAAFGASFDPKADIQSQRALPANRIDLDILVLPCHV